MIGTLLVIMLQACANENEVNQTEPSDGDEQIEETPSEQVEPDAEEVEQTVEEVMADIKVQLETDVALLLPSNIQVSEGMYLSALTYGEESGYKVKLFETASPVKVNDPQLEKLVPFAVLSGTLFELEKMANSEVNYQQIQEGMPTVDLGYDIVGYQEGAAGSTYTTFHEGRWSITVRSSTIDSAEDVGIDLAKEVVEKLEVQLLPIPHENGAILLTANEREDNPVEMNSVAWQEGKVLYEVEMAKPLPLIDFVTKR